MTDPLDLDAIEAREARHGAFYLTPHEQERAFAELRTARAERDQWKIRAEERAIERDEWEQRAETNWRVRSEWAHKVDALAARIEAARALVRAMDEGRHPSYSAAPDTPDLRWFGELRAALSGATEPREETR